MSFDDSSVFFKDFFVLLQRAEWLKDIGFGLLQCNTEVSVSCSTAVQAHGIAGLGCIAYRQFCSWPDLWSIVYK